MAMGRKLIDQGEFILGKKSRKVVSYVPDVQDIAEAEITPN